jgi:hypothetical protein
MALAAQCRAKCNTVLQTSQCAFCCFVASIKRHSIVFVSILWLCVVVLLRVYSRHITCDCSPLQDMSTHYGSATTSRLVCVACHKIHFVARYLALSSIITCLLSQSPVLVVAFMFVFIFVCMNVCMKMYVCVTCAR